MKKRQKEKSFKSFLKNNPDHFITRWHNKVYGNNEECFLGLLSKNLYKLHNKNKHPRRIHGRRKRLKENTSMLYVVV